MSAVDVMVGFVGWIAGLLTSLVAGKKLLELVIESYTAKLIEKFDQRYASREAFHDLKRRVGKLEGEKE